MFTKISKQKAQRTSQEEQEYKKVEVNILKDKSEINLKKVKYRQNSSP